MVVGPWWEVGCTGCRVGYRVGFRVGGGVGYWSGHSVDYKNKSLMNQMVK